MLRRLTVVLVLLWFTQAARASFTPSLWHSTLGNVSTNLWYQLTFTPDANGPTLRAGDTITLYDTGSFIGPAGLQFQQSYVDPGAAANGVVDNPGVLNSTYTYEGPTLTSPTQFTFQWYVQYRQQMNLGGQYLSTTMDHALPGSVIIPAGTGSVPEPALAGLMGVLVLVGRRPTRT